jgi:hypothetical protein
VEATVQTPIAEQVAKAHVHCRQLFYEKESVNNHFIANKLRRPKESAPDHSRFIVSGTNSKQP